jgi:integrase
LPFSNEELQKIFNNDKLKLNKKLFFVCLLLVTTGARPNEICQLWTDDIYQDNGIYKIRIVENEARDQSLKTKSSKRIIYLNSIVEKFGFIEYIKNQKDGMIFDLKKPKKKTYSTFISLDFTEILRSIGIEKKTMYCFRHTVVNRLKQYLVLQSINEDLVGHEGKGTNATVYSQQHSAENLKKRNRRNSSIQRSEFFHCADPLGWCRFPGTSWVSRTVVAVPVGIDCCRRSKSASIRR